MASEKASRSTCAPRHETAVALGSTGVPVTYLRAAVVLGGGSESFQTVYYLVKRLPAMVTPKWTTTRTQPIAVDDVISYLAAAGGDGPWTGREIQIAGPDVSTYGGMMEVMADAMGKRRPLMIRIPLLTPRLSSLWIGLVTPVDTGRRPAAGRGPFDRDGDQRPLRHGDCSVSSRPGWSRRWSPRSGSWSRTSS